MHRAIGVNVYVGTNATGGLSLQHAIERGCSALGEIEFAFDAAVVGQHNLQSVFMKHMDRQAIEEIPVLLKHISLRPLPDNGSGRQNKHILEFFNRHLQPYTKKKVWSL